MSSRLLATPEPKPGDVLVIGREASVQFADDRKWTYDGWIWLTGYVIDRHGNAAERREIFVQRHGLYRLPRRAETRPSTN
ncbi:hypothetical protein [Micromonospora sp. LOL_015]|uniref:hypothetical protein n=1 Tax=Micromonospora sp. LOL_015 TaxID=3345416 RepID=UPI003A8C3B42